MTWTIEALNREHPLPEGWRWSFATGGEPEEDPSRPWAFGRTRHGHDAGIEIIDGILEARDGNGHAFDPPIDVALAVLLANKAGGPSTDETASIKLGREGKRTRVKLKCTTCKHGQAHGPGGSRRCELASGELTYNDEPPGWCPLRGVAVEETSQLAELARKVGTNAVEIGMPYQDADGRWLMDLRGGSVLSFKDEQEVRSFGDRWDAQCEALKEASVSPSRCEIVGDTLRLRDVYGSSVCVLDLREVSFVRRLADEYSDGTATVWIVLRVGETLKLDLPTAADYERVADHVASLRGRA